MPNNIIDKIQISGQSYDVKDAAATTALGGLSLIKLTQAQYDALVTKDNSTLYVIVD